MAAKSVKMCKVGEAPAFSRRRIWDGLDFVTVRPNEELHEVGVSNGTPLFFAMNVAE